MGKNGIVKRTEEEKRRKVKTIVYYLFIRKVLDETLGSSLSHKSDPGVVMIVVLVEMHITLDSIKVG